jgi:hypothetical protein
MTRPFSTGSSLVLDLTSAGSHVHGVEIARRAWADLGGAEGYYAIALLLEGASRVVLVDEDSPRPLALRVLKEAGVEVVVADAESVPLAGIDAILALYSIEPRRVLLAHPRIRTALVGPARDPWDRGSTRPTVRGFRTRVAKWSTRLLMGEGACALADRDERGRHGGVRASQVGEDVRVEPGA